MRRAALALSCAITLALALSPGGAVGQKEKEKEKRGEAKGQTAELPKGFRDWVHTKSMVIPDKTHGLYGFHNIYANPPALKTLKAGGTYPEASIFVASFYEVVDRDGAVTAGDKLMDVVMVKDKKATETGGWAYSAFGPDGKPLAVDPVADCYNCHTSVRDTDYVFHSFVE
ncbi:MAG: cytochrome P460 family protein [Deferrisomatales bacterium]|nr:cytochrome P460 family protein [Deferrisomatales bacterium]